MPLPEGPAALSARRCLVLAAHPDDETLGASWLLRHSPWSAVVHLTDGAPEDRRYWPPLASGDRAEYAKLRRREALAALGLAGVPSERLFSLGATDQQAALALAPLSDSFARLLIDLSPALVVTHAYEGGHPDHDAAAFIARAALELLRRRGAPVPALVEMACYHGAKGARVDGEFIPSDRPEWAVQLGNADRHLKRSMLACHASQREVLAPVGLELERYRPAGACDWRLPPHQGPLLYERFGWFEGARWRALAAAALDLLWT